MQACGLVLVAIAWWWPCSHALPVIVDGVARVASSADFWAALGDESARVIALTADVVLQAPPFGEVVLQPGRNVTVTSYIGASSSVNSSNMNMSNSDVSNWPLLDFDGLQQHLRMQHRTTLTFTLLQIANSRAPRLLSYPGAASIAT